MANISREERERRKNAELTSPPEESDVNPGAPDTPPAEVEKPTVEESQVANPVFPEGFDPSPLNSKPPAFTDEEVDTLLNENQRLTNELETAIQQRDSALVELDAIKDELRRRSFDAVPGSAIPAPVADAAERAGRFAVADVEDDDPLDPMPAQDPRLGTDTPGWKEWAQRRAHRVATGGNR